MQWCDSDSFEWLNALLTSSVGVGILVLGTVRAEETGREHPFTRFMAGLRPSGIVLELPLTPLDAEETAELARLESAKPLESGNLGEIFQATRGNPLFVVESVRAGLHSMRVHAVIASRLAQLSAASYELAGVASVVGRPFSFELLEKATDWDESSLSQALDELWRRRIIESRGASEYDFTHDRLREVACAELSLVRQRYLHRRVARALVEIYGADIESWNGQIASHFEQAGMADVSPYFRVRCPIPPPSVSPASGRNRHSLQLSRRRVERGDCRRRPRSGKPREDHGVGQGLLQCPPSVRRRRGVHELHDGRRRGSNSGDVSRELRPAGGDQSEVRSGELLPRESEYPAGHGGREIREDVYEHD